MSAAVQTLTNALPSLTLRPSEQLKPEDGASAETSTTTTATASGSGQEGEAYRYAHLLPVFSPQTYPPLTPCEHADPGARALSHANPRAFLESASAVVEITPWLGTEVRGVSLAGLTSEGRDQLALEVWSNLWNVAECER
jgi:sulfonate dioxygenase